MATALGDVGNPDDRYLPKNENLAGPGWWSVWGFFDGLRGVTDRIEGITGDYAGTVGNLTGADRVKWELKADKEAFDQQQKLDWLTTDRGDNKVQMYVIGAAAVAVIALMAGR